MQSSFVTVIDLTLPMFGLGLPFGSRDLNGGIVRKNRLRSGHETRIDSLNILLTPVINRNRQTAIFDWLLPFIPKIHRTTIRFVYWLIDPYPAWQKTGVTYNQSFARIESRQDVAKSAKAIGKKPLYNALILGVGQSHGNEVTALAEHRLIHF